MCCCRVLYLLVTFNCFLSINSVPQQLHHQSRELQSYEEVTESKFDLIEKSSSPPDPPENFQINLDPSSQSSQVHLSWNPPSSKPQNSEENILKYEIQLEPLTSNVEGVWPQVFILDQNELLLEGNILESGVSYRIILYSRVNSQLSQPLEANFTTLPKAPSHFVLWYRNETTLMVVWEPPSGFFDGYKLEISPKDGPESTLLISREEYESGVKRAAFHHLHPGRAYNVSLVTLSESQESLPLVQEFRTRPLRPSNVRVHAMQFKSHPVKSVIVEWDPPSEDLGEFDGFSVYINHLGVKPSQKFVSRTKPGRALLEDPDLIQGQTYQIIVKTVSGRISSSKLEHNFTFIQPTDPI